MLGVDLDDDDIVDLAVTSEFGNTVSVLLGKGDGTFHTRTEYGTGGSPTAIAAGDFDRNGRVDLATANGRMSLRSSASVLLNTCIP